MEGEIGGGMPNLEYSPIVYDSENDNRKSVMAVGYNLISCDDITYPSLFQRHRADLSTQVGNIIEFGDNGQYYTVEKNNQVVIPYPYDPLLYVMAQYHL